MQRQTPAGLRRGSGHGFTLVELMITIAIVAILTAIALPSFSEINIRMNVTTTTNELVGAINLARAEAVKRGVDVTVASLSSGADWSTGWTVKAAAETLRSYPPLSNGYSLITAAAGTGSDAKQIVFSGRGDLGAVTSFDAAVCRPDHKPANSRHVQVAGSGAVTTMSGAPGSSCT